MDRSKLEETVRSSQEVVNLLRHGKSREGWAAFSGTLPVLQGSVLLCLQDGFLEEDIAALMLNDILAAMENQDEVLLADTLQNGVSGLLTEILNTQKGELP